MEPGILLELQCLQQEILDASSELASAALDYERRRDTAQTRLTLASTKLKTLTKIMDKPNGFPVKRKLPFF